MKKINQEIIINANKQRVWDTMLGKESYKVWTVPFSEGSYYEGDISLGNKVLFLGPNPETGKVGGMLSYVDKIDEPNFVSFKHVGFIMDGVEDCDSEEVKKWAPAYENYTFEFINDNETRLIIDTDTADEWMDFMVEAWRKALVILKSECEK